MVARAIQPRGLNIDPNNSNVAPQFGGSSLRLGRCGSACGLNNRIVCNGLRVGAPALQDLSPPSSEWIVIQTHLARLVRVSKGVIGRAVVPRRSLCGTCATRQIVSQELPIVYLTRHIEREWAITGQRTGRTDLPLIAVGERNLRRRGEGLKRLKVTKVFTIPLQRAARTCEIAGFWPTVKFDCDLVECKYRDCEGRCSAEIRAEHSAWQLSRDGCPGGESPHQVAARVARVVRRWVLLFSSGHSMRMLASQWIDLEPADAASFLMSTAGLRALGQGRSYLTG